MRRVGMILIAMVIGIGLAPLVLPLIAPAGGPARAQALPWTPTPTAPAVTPTPPAPAVTPTPTVAGGGGAADPILGPPAIVTPMVTPPPGQEPGGGGGGDPGGGGGGGGRTSGPPSPTAAPGTQPDRCEPNDTLTQPCALPTEVDHDGLTFVGDDPMDVLSLWLKAGRTYTIRAASTTGIDPALRVMRASDPTTVLAENDDVQPGTTDAVVTVTTERDEWYLVVVENRAPGDMRGRTYTFSARSAAAAPPPGAPAVATTTPARPVVATAGDLFENNYSPETAGVLVWGVPFDLSLVCPDPGQCASGDHDFFWVPVKAGVPLVVVTYDLGPGADPALTLYRPDATATDPATGITGWRPWAGNDDVVPGFTLRAQLLVTPDWSGYALLVVAPSARRDPPPLPPAVGAPGRYRLMVGPPALAPVQAVLAAQDDLPVAPTATPTVAPPPPPTGQPLTAPIVPTPASDAREVIKQASVEGEAEVIVDGTGLFAAAPPTDQDALAVYPAGAVVILLGETYAGWVKVQPVDSVMPGWMFGPHLRPRTPPPAAPPAGPGGAAAPPAGPGGAAAPPAGPGGAAAPPAGPGAAAGAPQLRPLPPLPTPTPVRPLPEARALTIEVCALRTANDQGCPRPLEGVRVELVRVADGAVLFVGTTNREGRVDPSITVAPGTAIDVQIGALGLRARVPPTATLLPVRVVEEVAP